MIPVLAAAATVLGAFPTPGSPVASPQTQLSLHGVTTQTAGPITVTGSVTGPHTGKLKAWSDGTGVSWVPDTPFSTGGETVSVQTDLPIPGATDGDYSFTVNRTPAAGLTTDISKVPPAVLQGLTGQIGTVRSQEPTYRTAPDFKPPKITITRRDDARTSGDPLFLSPAPTPANTRPEIQNGPLIADPQGRPLWFDGAAKNAQDLRVQTYQGKEVLTYWEGDAILGVGTNGRVRLLDDRYKTVKTVRGGNGYGLDLHESRITPEGSLLAIVYNPVSADLTSVGGSADARAIDTVVQEIDIPTGLVKFEFHSVGQIPLDENKAPVGPGDDVLDDYVHGNSVAEMNDGSLLLSGRSTWTGYKLDRATGAIQARYGGKRSDYAFDPPSAAFAFQHDLEQQPDGALKVFDNGGYPDVHDQSRALVLKVDEATKTISPVRALTHGTPPLHAGTQGNVQALGDGNLFTNWGSQGFFTEFDPDGRTVLDGFIARGQFSYRAYRFPWTGRPTTKPALAVTRTKAYASWNGATQVVRWRLQSGSSTRTLKTVTTRVVKGFETTLPLRRPETVVRVQALSRNGRVLGTSRVVRSR